MTWPTDLARDLASGTYEVTVAGTLGPALRAALQPLVAATTDPCTTVRTVVRGRTDVADLLAALESKGLEVRQVAVRVPTPRLRERGPRAGRRGPSAPAVRRLRG
jgi:hypothetical protein